MWSRLVLVGDLIAGCLDIVGYVRREVTRLDRPVLMDCRGYQPQNSRAIVRGHDCLCRASRVGDQAGPYR
jgi:hypothetical protein